MRKHCYNNLTDFYANTGNICNHPEYEVVSKMDDKSWTGLSLSDTKKYQFSYPIGINMLSQFKEVKVERELVVKYYNSYDGYDIDIDRLFDNMDFLLDSKKKKNTPKTIDIYIAIGELCDVEYSAMLMKTYTALHIIDKLETSGVRCAVFACAAFSTVVKSGEKSEQGYLEVCIKNYSDGLNLGALCTAISPWMFRHYFLKHYIGHYPSISVANGASRTAQLPSDLKGIVIGPGQCHTLESANKKINTIKIEN